MIYHYKSEIVRVIDGDTVVAMIDLGFCTYNQQVLRLYGIDTPELRGGTTETKELAKEAKAHLKQLLEDYGPITVHTIQDNTDKYGRYLAILYGRDEDRPVNLNHQMIYDGHAKEYPGK